MAEPRRGKTYVCLHCEAAGKAYVEARYRVIAHIYKHHLALDKAPYYCTLCLLRCSTKSALINHVTKYSRHRLAAAELGATDDRRYLVENPYPATVTLGKDYREISSQDSSRYVGHEGVDDLSDNEGEFYREPAPVTRSNPNVSTATSDNGLISVQLTPEMLASLLQSQPMQNNVFSQSVRQAFSSGSVVTRPSNIPMYSPTMTSVPTYTPTPIVQSTSSLLETPPLLKTPPFLKVPPPAQRTTQPELTSTVMSTGQFMVATPLVTNPSERTFLPGVQSHGQTRSPLLNLPLNVNTTCQTSAFQQINRSVLNTPVLSTTGTTENILPDLLGEHDETTTSEFDFGFGENWLERQAKGQNNSTLNTANSENPLPTVEHSKNDTEMAKDKISECGEPKHKKQKLDTEVREDSDINVVKMIENVVESSMKQLVEAFEKNSRAIRGVDKTMGELTEVMTKMNRTLERMGEEQPGEHERRLEESQKRDREITSRMIDENNNNRKDSSTSRKHDSIKKESTSKNESRRDGKDKENKPLKSVVVKK